MAQRRPHTAQNAEVRAVVTDSTVIYDTLALQELHLVLEIVDLYDSSTFIPDMCTRSHMHLKDIGLSLKSAKQLQLALQNANGIRVF